jgi:fructose/tagatose bisphosphate aldolase
MVDGSRLSLEDNIDATRRITRIAHAAGIPVEGELGAVLGHESGPLPPYEELFASGQGFTSPETARQFVTETGVDWLSVAVGNVHGAIAASVRSGKKVEARLNLDQLQRIYEAAQVPLVLHGGTGIRREYIQGAFRRGIAKINIATAIRQPYEANLTKSTTAAQQAVYDATMNVLTEDLGLVAVPAVISQN